MKPRLTLLALLAAFALPAFAVDHYFASASTTALTIQQPASGARRITFGDVGVSGVTVYCAGAQTATVSWNGTAATATAGAEVRYPNTGQASGVTVWTGSDVGAGTTGPAYPITAGATVGLNLNWLTLAGSSTAKNVTITTTGTCTITFNYSAS